jgi:hypothetical protein
MNNSIVVRCIGGVGNQLFQISLAYSLSKKFNRQILVDTSAYNHYKIRDYGLNNFKINKEVRYLTKGSLSFFTQIYFATSQVIYRVFQYILKNVTGTNKIGFNIFSYLQQASLVYNFDRYYYPVTLPEERDACVYGYFQSVKYFESHAEELKELLQVSTPLIGSEVKLLQRISNSNSVAISIRVGDDYLHSKSLNVFSEGYFNNAVKYIKEKVDNPVFFIFSDDIDRVKKMLTFDDEVVFIEGFDEFQSLRLMYSCKHFILANSSFSWWGAFLSTSKNKIVVVPRKWYRDNDAEPDIYLNEMIRM